jgi:hypothetical protein
MRYIICILTVLGLQGKLYSFSKDSLRITQLEYKIEQLDNQAKEVRRDQINYQIEKDLLKETYSNNYDRISLMITIILGIIGVLGYLGIRDINTIKKEYSVELANLKQVQKDISNKYADFQMTKEKYDTELKDIFRTNEEQNTKIKVLEIKEKISSLFHNKQYGTALEFCIVALELAPNDLSLLKKKAMINTRMQSYNDACASYKKVLEQGENDHICIINLTEVYLLNRQSSEFESMINKYSDIFSKEENKSVKELFSIIANYQSKNIEKIKETILTKLDPKDLNSKKKRTEDWTFEDMLVYIANEPHSEEKTFAQNLLWYLDGQTTGADLCARTKIPMPKIDTK